MTFHSTLADDPGLRTPAQRLTEASPKARAVRRTVRLAQGPLRGLSWQIMPIRLTELLNDPDEAAAQRVMSAMQMTKIDIAELERAYAAGA